MHKTDQCTKKIWNRQTVLVQLLSLSPKDLHMFNYPS